jgi:ABC-2 type transport system ATP-binding protein
MLTLGKKVMKVLEVSNLQKVYGTRTRALDGLSLTVDGGSVFGLLGPNGAGKTTFVRIVATQLLPSAGSVSVLGHDVVAEPNFVRQKVAIVPQEGRPMSLQTPYEHIVTYLAVRGVSFHEAKRRANRTIESLNLQNYRNTICTNLSGGLRQRVLIAMAMSTEADLLVLDEPTIGLDPVARVDVWNLIRDYVTKDGRTILLTTHYMDEAETLADRLAIVNKGKVIALGSASQITSRLRATHVATVRRSMTPEAAETEFGRFGRVLRAGASIRILTDQEGASEIAAICLRTNAEVSVRQVNLEDVFISEVGEQIGDN